MKRLGMSQVDSRATERENGACGSTLWGRGMDYFGSVDPKNMPPHFFCGTLGLDYSTAVRANFHAQDYTVAPRFWYVDARFRCSSCKTEFVWSADEQKTWFETYRFYVDTFPTRCRDCRASRRRAVRLGQEYAAKVAQARSHGTSELKQRIVEIIDELEAYWGRIPNKVRVTREIFLKQLSRGQLP